MGAYMKIKYIDIQNFRKLRSCRIEIGEKNTIFVGANNSGKTSAMEALIMFLKKGSPITINDFTISNDKYINDIGDEVLKLEQDAKKISINRWYELLPSLDIWLEVNDSELTYCTEILPSLDWHGELLGVRIIYEPSDLEALYKDYVKVMSRKVELLDSEPDTEEKEKIKNSVWPSNLIDFLSKKIDKYFSKSYYILDANMMDTKDKQDSTLIQKLTDNSIKLTANPLKNLIRVDLIEAQRDFSSSDLAINDNDKSGSLSRQLQKYYKVHLNPEESPSINDLRAIEAIRESENVFNSKLSEKFEKPIKQIETLGYPGIANPKIKISTKLSMEDGLKHESAVQYSLSDDNEWILPERYNGLGYQNLIAIVFELMSFRDAWMRVGKMYDLEEEKQIEPIHLVLVEEPEAHLHAQVQQVFMKKAYEILRDNENIKNNEGYCTQLVISTHSSNIIHSSEFKNLRYFKRMHAEKGILSPTSKIINMSNVFGNEDQTQKFVTRYLKSTHCDLFFADAAILIEGAAERILLPQFIKKVGLLDSRFISIIEISGSHAHRLKNLIESLGIPCLIITDLDSVSSKSGKSIIPKRGDNQITNNDTLKSWIPKLKNIDDLLDLKEDEKVLTMKNTSKVRVAYQFPIKVKLNVRRTELIPNTFEDAIVYENIDMLKKLSGYGLIKSFKNAITNNTSKKALEKAVFDILHNKNVKKAQFALDLLYSDEVEKIQTPSYIKNGLEWLDKELSDKNEL